MFTLPVRIAGIGYYLPKQVVENRQLVEEFNDPDWTEEKIFSKTGIRSRHVSAHDEFVSDMAVQACRDLQRKTGLDPVTIDFLVLCTQTPDYALPATACIVQKELGFPVSCMAFDFNQGCSGYVYGLGIAAGLIASGQANRGILVTSEAYSKWIHPMDRSARTIFADAACATLVEADPDGVPRMGPFLYGTDGRGYERLIVPASGAHSIGLNPACLAERVDKDGHRRTDANLFMDGPEIFRFAVTTVPALFNNLLAKAGVTLDKIDRIVFHQANMFMLNYLQKLMKIPLEKIVFDLEDVGNTVSSTIPLAIGRAAERGEMANGDTLALLGFGVGYSWSGALVYWGGRQ